MLHKMGFHSENQEPINWAHVLDVFHQENTHDKLAELLLEGAILEADPDYRSSPVASLHLHPMPVGAPIELPPHPSTSS